MRWHKPRRGAGTARALAAGRQDAAAAPGPQAPAGARDLGRIGAGSTVLAAHLAEPGATACAAAPGQPARAGQDRVT